VSKFVRVVAYWYAGGIVAKSTLPTQFQLSSAKDGRKANTGAGLKVLIIFIYIYIILLGKVKYIIIYVQNCSNLNLTI